MHTADLLTRRAHLTPQREALLDLSSGRRYTYAELNARAKRAANMLRDQFGLRQGQRVSILAQNSVVYVDLLFGLAKIGAILAPLNWRLVARELAYIVDDCRPHVLVVGPDYVETAAELLKACAIEHVLTTDEPAPQLPGADVYETLLQDASVDEPPRPALPPEQLTELPQCILYTSGTTGRPKGATIPQRQVLWNCINTVISWGLSEDDVSPVVTPLFHSGGLFVFLTPLLYAGGRIILVAGFDAEASLPLIQDERCTVVLGVPTLFQMWRNSEAYAAADFSCVRFFISGGAPCPPQLIHAWRSEKNVVFRQGYGLTEVGPNCFSMTDEESVSHVGSVGKPIFHSAMRVVDEAGLDAPPGEVGELLIRGPHVCSGYWRNPEATTEALRDGWFHTGDMVRRDAHGFYTIIGRFKDMIISGGENIYAAEVEAVFKEHNAVAEAALIGRPDEKWGEVGLVALVLKEGQHADAADLLAFCRQRLASYKLPKEIVFVDRLPISPYGKVEKRRLKEHLLQRGGRHA